METIEVRHALIDGAHFFTPVTKRWVGLCAGCKDYDTGLLAARRQIATLARENYGIANLDFLLNVIE